MVGSPGYVAGITDVPSSNAASVGYSPGSDVVLCWDNYRAVARQAANSRVYGGIHTKKDGLDGLLLGERIGKLVGAATVGLTPLATKPKGVLK